MGGDRKTKTENKEEKSKYEEGDGEKGTETLKHEDRGNEAKIRKSIKRKREKQHKNKGNGEQNNNRQRDKTRKQGKKKQ